MRKFLCLVLLTGIVYADPEPQQQQMQQQIFVAPPPVQEQLQLNLSEKCIEKIDHYETMYNLMKADGDTLGRAYYKYLLNKWEKRCYPQ